MSENYADFDFNFEKFDGLNYSTRLKFILFLVYFYFQFLLFNGLVFLNFFF